MILVIGKTNCSRCEMVKNILNTKEINYKYENYDNLSQEEKDLYMKMAKESHLLSFPLIIQNEKVIDLKEVK
jgi:glutaredoxin